MRLRIFICLLLAGITLAIYWPVRHFDFVHDDDQFFLTGPDVESGLGWQGLKWVMTSVVVSNWHPMTVFSFLLMHQFFGMNPGAEHLLNAILHSANAVLLFIVLTTMTGQRSEVGGQKSAVWKCAFVAAVFAWHPLRVESVAWIAERKDVLCMFFLLLSLWCYVGYTRRKKEKGKRKRYWAALVFFALSLMSKAMVVTLPFLLLLLDFWPMERLQDGGRRSEVRGQKAEVGGLGGAAKPICGARVFPVLLEKIPFFVLTIIFCVLTFCIQKSHSAVVPTAVLGIGDRVENATLSYVYYLGHFFWPANLSIFHEYPASFNIVQVLLAALLLAAITLLCLLEISRRPYLAVGWFWYLGTMVPVIGLVQVGIDAMADRYTYLPLIGPLISLVWLLSEWGIQSPTNADGDKLKKEKGKRIGGEMRESVLTEGRERAKGFQPRIDTDQHGYSDRMDRISGNCKRASLVVMAVVVLSACVVATRAQLMFWRNSVTLFNRAIAVAPEYPYSHFPLALGLEEQKRLREAATQFQYSLAMKMPKSFHSAHFNNIYFLSDLHLSGLLAQMGHERPADHYLEAALKMNPDSALVMNNLAWSLATSPDPSIRNGTRAVELAERACELTDYKKTIFIGTLAAAYAEAGRFDDAVGTAQKAIANAQRLGETDLAQRNHELLQLYLNHKVYREGNN